VWDVNGDGFMQADEMETVFNAMDLDGDTHPTDVEIAAYLTRNQYLICRPLRDLVLTELDKKANKAFRKVLHSPKQPITEKQFAIKTAKMCQ
jgi:hypothetical protein